MASKVLTLATILALYSAQRNPPRIRIDLRSYKKIQYSAKPQGGEGRGKSLRAFPSKNNTQRYDEKRTLGSLPRANANPVLGPFIWKTRSYLLLLIFPGSTCFNR
ncbi:hypothetical protein F4824DRAFT_289443 [Ustulina deusta]|nr:hypothetical protein F4823DRAFT_173064 [Ustulina deusta]KAI3332572.1 hypothetical protein F4824DRAFT_289443 [Ustulina deusta]